MTLEPAKPVPVSAPAALRSNSRLPCAKATNRDFVNSAGADSKNFIAAESKKQSLMNLSRFTSRRSIRASAGCFRAGRRSKQWLTWR
jgi:hypothetical protein